MFALPVYMGSYVLFPSGSDREGSKSPPAKIGTQMVQQYPQPSSAAGQSQGLEVNKGIINMHVWGL